MFGISRATAIQAVTAIALPALERYTPEKIVRIGSIFVSFLDFFRTEHPDEVPKKKAVGLLSTGDSYPVSDFELAVHLVETGHKFTAELEKAAKGMPILLAYLVVVSLPDARDRDIGWEFALEHAATEGGVRVRRTQQLQDAVEKYKEKESRNKERASMGGIKGAQTRKAAAIRTDEVVAAAKRLGWPTSTDGVNKRLSRKFNCSPDHIGRILRKS